MFSVQTAPEKVKDATIAVHFRFVFEKNVTRSRKSRDYRDVIVFENFRFQNVFCAHETEKPTFSNSSGFKSPNFLTDKCGR